MNSYEITLTNGTTGKEFTILAGNANAARAEALAHAARLTKETGTQWRVNRCDPA